MKILDSSMPVPVNAFVRTISEVTNNDQKANVLHTFFTGLLGAAREPVWCFSLNSIYPTTTRPLYFLDGPFDLPAQAPMVLGLRFTNSPGPSFRLLFSVSFRLFIPTMLILNGLIDLNWLIRPH